MLKKCVSLLSLALLSAAIHAEDRSLQIALRDSSTINFSTDAQETVIGNQMQARLQFESKSTKNNNTMHNSNPQVEEALQSIYADKRVKVETHQYQTLLRDHFIERRLKEHHTNEQTEKTDLIIRSEQWSALSEISGVLQKKGWKLQNVSFEVSPEQQQEIEERLTQKAIETWSNRAKKIAKQFQLKSWKAHDLKINKGSINSNDDDDELSNKPYLAKQVLFPLSITGITPEKIGASTLLIVHVTGEMLGE